ncbi:hypothetical protein [Beihai Nido-like virus 2]|uniref:Uncharacterized protein n=1 Tax=Beihai Nido-like virus 2 TaxID=1922351 RepID=A0A1L3KJ12_9NIDO|nr:hypothetical protein [Beihai Nido-like virus 2]APG77319.1 hypothetical protein [Beihai Nido-like virus 2]
MPGQNAQTSTSPSKPQRKPRSRAGRKSNMQPQSNRSSSTPKRNRRRNNRSGNNSNRRRQNPNNQGRVLPTQGRRSGNLQTKGSTRGPTISTRDIKGIIGAYDRLPVVVVRAEGESTDTRFIYMTDRQTTRDPLFKPFIDHGVTSNAIKQYVTGLSRSHGKTYELKFPLPAEFGGDDYKGKFLFDKQQPKKEKASSSK